MANHFPWQSLIQYTTIITLFVWAAFFFYDYFIVGSTVKEDIYDNPIRNKASEQDTREQVLTDKVEFDGMLKTK